ncbi:MAG: hypothetical protein B6240_07615 [Desulfobacteraceae bacterium 4572_87]|nr:MAG: hypothetical protein B6240_07615 [Desulfobacteraceae bacterium 4572_87]
MINNVAGVNKQQSQSFKIQDLTPSYANLKPSVKKISLRLPESMLEGLKLLANKRDVPYQSLLKIFLSERIEFKRGNFLGATQLNTLALSLASNISPKMVDTLVSE